MLERAFCSPMMAESVTVWSGDCLPNIDLIAQFEGLLDPAQRDKARAFSNQQLRQRYVAVRGWLRLCLAHALNCQAGDLQFGVNPHGKPYLLNGSVDFNLSHSRDRLAIAIGNVGEIGLDIECCKVRSNLSLLADRCFGGDELLYWQGLAESARVSAFYRLWTCKEAFVKAVGRGIAVGLERCEVDCGHFRGFSRIPAEFGLADDWKITEIEMGVGYRGALVTANRSFHLSQKSLPDSL